MTSPRIAITADLIERNGRETAMVTMAYARAVVDAGGQAVLLPPIPGTEPDALARFDGFVFTGGDDPRTEPFGAPTHPATTPVPADRQAFEAELLARIHDARPETPVLGVCLGMQMMALVAGGRLDQYLPETTPDAGRHWDREHPIVPEAGAELAAGTIFSRHKQAIVDPGSLAVLARSDDGLIEAVGDPRRPMYLGVQWHPERTAFAPLGQQLFARLVRAAARAQAERDRSSVG